MKLYADMSEEELASVDLIKASGLNIGDRVSHLNAGKTGGNGRTISSQLGVIVGHQNQGLYSWGGLCITVTVRWDDSTEQVIGTGLAVKE